jgi:hypothetical protein
MPYLNHHFIAGLSSIEIKILWKDYLQSAKASTKIKLAQPPTKRKRECEIERRSSTNSNDETKDKISFRWNFEHQREEENEPLWLDDLSDHSQNSSAPVSANVSQSPPPRKVASRNISYVFSLSAPPKLMNPKKSRAGDDSQASQFQEEDGFRSPT